VKAVLGGDIVEADGIVAATGQSLVLPEGMVPQTIRFRMVITEHQGKERVVALDAIGPVDGRTLGIRLIGAQMTQFARPENEAWIIQSERVRFQQMVREQSFDDTVPSESLGVPGSIYQTNVDVPLAMKEPFR
jgi:hypothetical protein